MKYEVEEWQRWEYPSNWSYVESFDTLDEAIEFIHKQNDRVDYRVIQELHRVEK